MPVNRVASIYFVCLANSHKLGGRCIAGTMISARNNTRPILNSQGRPKWVRPVDRNTEGNAIPLLIANDIHIGDIVEIVNPMACPCFAQQENVYYDALNVVGRISDYSVLKSYLAGYRGGVLGNYGKAVIPEKYETLNYSILLIHPESVLFYLLDRSEQNKKPQPRVKFTLTGHEYDFPITDPSFYDLVSQNIEAANAPGDCYITASLGLEHEGYHSKLAACIFKLSSGNLTERDDGGHGYSDENVPFPTIEDMPPETYLPDLNVSDLPKPQPKQKKKSGSSINTRSVFSGRMFHTFTEPLDLDEKADKDSEQLRNERRTHFESLKGFNYVIRTLPDNNDVEFFNPRTVEEPKKRLIDLPKQYYKFDEKFEPCKVIGDSSRILLVKVSKPIKISIHREDVFEYFVNESYDLLCSPRLKEVMNFTELRNASWRYLGRDDVPGGIYDNIKFDECYNFLNEKYHKVALLYSSQKYNEFKVIESDEILLSEIVAFGQLGINLDERSDEERVKKAILSYFSFLLNNSSYAEDFVAKIFILIEQIRITRELWKRELEKLSKFIDFKSTCEFSTRESHYAYIDEAGNTVLNLPHDTIGVSRVTTQKLVCWISPHPQWPGKRLFTLADITGYVYYTWEVSHKEVNYALLDEKRILSRCGFDDNGVRITGHSYMTVLGIREDSIDIETIRTKSSLLDSPSVVAIDGTVIPPSRVSILKDGQKFYYYHAVNKDNKRYLITIDGKHEIADALYEKIKDYQ